MFGGSAQAFEPVEFEGLVSREAATDSEKTEAAAHAAAAICRPSRAPEYRDAHYLGLTPQAMSLSRLPASPYGLRRDESALVRMYRGARMNRIGGG